MRESNFSFPLQNRACVCISSRLYDRRALDTTSPLPLLNSLTRLTYLTSTSPQIRETLTHDGGFERLIWILRDFCISPPPPENHSLIYGLSPPSLPRPPQPPTFNPNSFSHRAAHRFSLALECVVNIGVHGSESVRIRIVQAGLMDVLGCVLITWLLSKGFYVCPRSSAIMAPSEPMEQTLLKRRLQREQAEIARRLARQQRPRERNIIDDSSVANLDADISVSTDNSANVTPLGSGSPTSVPGGHSGTVIGQPIRVLRLNGEQRSGYFIQNTPTGSVRGHGEGSGSTSVSRPENDEDGDGEQDGAANAGLGQLQNQQAAGALRRPRCKCRLHSPEVSGPGPFREGDVLGALKLLGFLSKYAHVRQAFYKPFVLYPTLELVVSVNNNPSAGTPSQAGPSTGLFESLDDSGKEKAPVQQAPSMVNMFSLVEGFTYHLEVLESPAHRQALFPAEIHYWAGVIMRNACRKDDSSGLRRCANMLCGKWETFRRDFPMKCRKCRRVKYCSKDCLSKAWKAGHRFWCNAACEGEDNDPGSSRIATGDDASALNLQVQ